ncbi:MAG: biopolymer transporter ExbD [Gammaproteobacteria bacterium]|nr:biopolymer transporter ExbD [Gammaproteobacteria bacterium]MDE0441717.1 biopolymer transporter ExbD [Gammaproteobacteria bacterium]
MRQISRRKPDEEWEINTTPMLDIVFIMLIFFIVTTSFVREPGIDPVRPLAQTAATKERANILIAVSSADQVWMNNTSVSPDGIRVEEEQIVQTKRRVKPEKPPPPKAPPPPPKLEVTNETQRHSMRIDLPSINVSGAAGPYLGTWEPGQVRVLPDRTDDSFQVTSPS